MAADGTSKTALDEPIIVSNPEIMGGDPVFRGTRVPVEVLFGNLAEGLTVDEIVESYPTLDKADVLTVLDQACEKMRTSARRVS
jgi:uncharacterized protein (DUF433 family)